MITLALAGVFLTSYMTQMELTSCSGCGKVLRHAAARPFGIPLSLVGAGFYALVLLACLFPRPPLSALVGLIKSALVISIGLTAYAAISLRAYCGWCLASLFMILTMAIVSIVWRRRVSGAPPISVLFISSRQRLAVSIVGLLLALLAFYRLGIMYQVRTSHVSPQSHTAVSFPATPDRNLGVTSNE